MPTLALISLAFVLGSLSTAQTPPAAPAAAPAAKPPDTREPGLYGEMTTTLGVIKFQLFEKESPITVHSFVELCQGRKQWRDPKTRLMVRRPLIPGTVFHRVIPGFMIQGGDPTATGAGDVGFVIKDEFSDLTFDRPGRFGMANRGPETGSSQFFITEVPTPHLNGKHTIFAQVTEGLELINQIARVPRGAENKPVTDVKMISVKFERVGPVPPNPPEGLPPAKKVVTSVKKSATPAAGTTKKAVTPAATTTKKAAAPVAPAKKAATTPATPAKK